jgi:hypothetical protein
MVVICSTSSMRPRPRGVKSYPRLLRLRLVNMTSVRVVSPSRRQMIGMPLGRLPRNRASSGHEGGRP